MTLCCDRATCWKWSGSSRIDTVAGHAKELGWWGILPPIRRDGQSWWLPLSDRAVVALSSALVRCERTRGESEGGAFDPVAIRTLDAAIHSDPPLLLWVMLHHSGDDWLSPIDLAQWLMENALDLFSGGEWILAAPEITDDLQRRWSRLMALSLSMPAPQWPTLGIQWLSAMGTEVEPSWAEDFPKLIWDDEPNPCGKLSGSTLLQSIARQRDREMITERSLSQLAESRKNAAAKQLAYGLSHEINNPLANISARAQGLQRGETDPDRIGSLEQIVQQVYRAHEMIAGLMFFANPTPPHQERLDLNAIVQTAVQDFRQQANDADIRLLKETWHEDAWVNADRLMILEAVRALIRNALEAVLNGGTVVVSVQPSDDAGSQQSKRNSQKGTAELNGQLNSKAGEGRWLIHIADSGPGITAEAAKHAFDPFYSGREAGRGLGLGLCRAYRVAKLHHATIRLTAGLAGCVATIAIAKAAG